MLSPLDLKNKMMEPKKRKYYDKDETDDYLELVMEQYKQLYDENLELQKNVKSLNDGVQYYRSIENTMQKALVLAEKTAKETKDAAQLKAEAIEKDANTKADKIVAEAEQEYDKLKEKCLSLVQQFNQYKMQLKQVASAQLELITSDSFDVYSPEIEAIRNEKDNMIAEQVPEEPKAPKAPTKMEIPEPLVKEQPVMKETVEKEPEDLSETMVLPDVKKEKRAKKKNEELQEDILTADTIDLSDTLNQIQKPKDADTKEVTDALVLDPVDAVVKEPFEAVPNSAVTLESNPEMLSLEPEEDKKEKETPSLDSLLQNINLGKKNKKKKVEVSLKVTKPETAENKEAGVKVLVPNGEFYASKICNTFEESVDVCIEALEKQLVKYKEKQRSK